MKNHILISFLLFFFVANSSFGQLAVNATNVDYTIDFESSVPNVSNGAFSGSGFQPAPSVGRLDSDAWRIEDPNMPYGSNAIGGSYALGCGGGGVNDQGGVYCFQGGSINGRALGLHPSASAFTPGFVELKVLNNTGQYITQLSLDYTLHVRNDDNRANYFNTQFFYSTTNNFVALASTTAPHTVDFSSMDYTSPGPGSPGSQFFAVPMSETLNGIYVKPGEYFYIRWRTGDVDGTGTRDEFGIDDIVINVDGVNELTFYSQNSGILSTSNFTSTALWSTVPTGGIQYKMTVLVPDGDFRIQNGHTITLYSSHYRLTLKDLIIDTGGTLLSNTSSSSISQRYLNLWGDILCEGQIGTPSGANSGIGFNLNPGTHTISGAGPMYISRIRKSNLSYGAAGIYDGYCQLTFQSDVNLLWSSGNCLYNDRAASAGGTNLFDVTIDSGATVSALGNVGMDQTDPTSNSVEAGGAYVVNGALHVDQALYLTTNNSVIPCSFTIGDGGVVNAGYLKSEPSGTAGHTLNLMGNSHLNVTGHPTNENTWVNFSVVNNVLNFQPNSTIEYSKSGLQNVETRITYRNLLLSGSVGKWAYGGTGLDLVIMEDLDITGSAILNPNGRDIEIHGHWSSYDESGFDEGVRYVKFMNDGTPGTTTINCPGGETFHDVGILSGTVIMNDPVTVTHSMGLDARLELNGNELYLMLPSIGISLFTPSGNEIIVSEDVAHAGKITYAVGTYTGPVTYPFGTSSGLPIYSRFTLNSGDAGEVSMATYGTSADNLPWPTSPVLVNNLNSTSGLSPDNRTATVDRFWSVTKSENNANADVEFSFVNAEAPGAPFNALSLLRAQRYDDSSDQWQAALPGQTVLVGTHSANTNTVVVPGVTEFSPWAISSDNSPLPVELIDFTGKRIAQGIQLEWSTASEMDNDGFELWRSGAAEDFEFVSWTDGSGNSSALLNYDELDLHPNEGMNYYKLVQIDFDGTKEESEVIGIEWKEESTELRLDLTVGSYLIGSLNQDIGDYHIELFNLGGQLIEKRVGTQKRFQISLNDLPKGAYVVRVSSSLVMTSAHFIH